MLTWGLNQYPLWSLHISKPAIRDPHRHWILRIAEGHSLLCPRISRENTGTKPQESASQEGLWHTWLTELLLWNKWLWHWNLRISNRLSVENKTAQSKLWPKCVRKIPFRPRTWFPFLLPETSLSQVAGSKWELQCSKRADASFLPGGGKGRKIGKEEGKSGKGRGKSRGIPLLWASLVSSLCK